MENRDQELIEGFRKVCQSLKLYRRAELVDENGDALIDALYVDPLPANKVLSTLLEPHTTFLIGRKGTGKSTLFQKAQKDLLQRQHAISAYLDIKTIFESSQVDPAFAQRIDEVSDALPRQELERFLLHKAFLESLIGAIKEQLKKRITSSIFARIRETLGGNIAQLDAELDELAGSLRIPTFDNAVGILRARVKEARTDVKAAGMSAGANVGPTPALTIAGTLSEAESISESSDFTNILFRTLDLKSYIVKLRDLLSRGGVRQLFVLIDDFSELPEHAMVFVVDSLLAPLNNWSEELVKLKVAAYPGRVYYGDIDKTKIDEVHLDLFKLYAPADVSSMEQAAIDFTKKLVEKRFAKFLPGRMDEVLDTADGAIWRELFFASLANPRILGYVLHFASERSLIKGGKISVRSVKEAVRKYYEDKIEAYFGLGRFLHSSFSERLSIYSLKELLEIIVNRARELRKHSSEIFQKISGTPPTSHFYIPTSMEGILQSLELNFFVTKYFEMADRSGQRVSVFCLNYGLCERYSIRFGRPSGEREFRLYFVERVFDYAGVIRAFLNKNQEISCAQCKATFEHDQLDALRMYGMQCPKCRGDVNVTNLSLKYESELRKVSDQILLGRTELGILSALNGEDDPLRPKDIAAELDCSYQLIGRRAKGLEERDLIVRDRDGGQRIYRITEMAQDAYFADASIAPLAVD
ncbi:winged helix-turn-helix domain-containing protein [Thermomonas sp.]|jgi:DNA-binding MarR family transcriptional regulator|uniref:winged helix-turn-helix domain-containing protein n=1 Tax=Thermomonas sp. TaxID=1971895 RepID=UPI00257AD282|nr:winged helix-turn-helix domain-containing protein [Thermomonas sp.]